MRKIIIVKILSLFDNLKTRMIKNYIYKLFKENI